MLHFLKKTSTPSCGSPHSDFLKADFFVTFKLFTSGSQFSLLLWQTEIYQHWITNIKFTQDFKFLYYFLALFTKGSHIFSHICKLKNNTVRKLFHKAFRKYINSLYSDQVLSIFNERGPNLDQKGPKKDKARFFLDFKHQFSERRP